MPEEKFRLFAAKPPSRQPRKQAAVPRIPAKGQAEAARRGRPVPRGNREREFGRRPLCLELDDHQHLTTTADNDRRNRRGAAILDQLEAGACVTDIALAASTGAALAAFTKPLTKTIRFTASRLPRAAWIFASVFTAQIRADSHPVCTV